MLNIVNPVWWRELRQHWAPLSHPELIQGLILFISTCCEKLQTPGPGEVPGSRLTVRRAVIPVPTGNHAEAAPLSSLLLHQPLDPYSPSLFRSQGIATHFLMAILKGPVGTKGRSVAEGDEKGSMALGRCWHPGTFSDMLQASF